MNLRPLLDRVVVKRLVEEETTKSGIYIPVVAREKPVMGEVVAVGPGKLLKNGALLPLGLKVGDKVLLSKYGAMEVTLDGNELVIINYDDIVGVIS